MPDDTSVPRPYETWRTDPIDRAEDAAYVLGYDLMRYCRSEALAKASEASPESRAVVEKAVDTALHNVMDLLEGFFRTTAGSQHTVQYVLSLRVRDRAGTEVENIPISPCLIDLPIGYWAWRDGQFRGGSKSSQ